MSEKLLEIFDINRKKIAETDKVFGVTETRKLSGVGEMAFTLPEADPKAEDCELRNFVRIGGGEMYRIIDYGAEDSEVSTTTYQCEHAIATLADSLMFGDRILEGYTTRDAIGNVISGQGSWALDRCDFSHRYDYAWTSTNRLKALLSIPMPFTEYYRFVFDTAVYPWRISLLRMDAGAKPGYYIFSGLNFLRSRKTAKSTPVVTRLYCQGYGEGINQLGIEKVNPTGKPYIDASAEAIRKYGIVEGHFIDRSYESADALYQAGTALISKIQEPRVEYEVEAADLEGIASAGHMLADVGEIIQLEKDRYRTFITEVQRNYDNPGDMRLTLANTPEDMAETLADIADRQKIEATYSQGATQIWASQLQDNASPSSPMVFKLWIPDATRIVNSVRVKIELQRFRYYSRTTTSGGGSTRASSGGGGSEPTSSGSGGGAWTSEAGGEASITSPQRTIPISTYTSLKYAIGTAGHYRAQNTDYATVTALGTRHRHYDDHDHLFTTSILIPSLVINVPGHRHRTVTASHSHTVTIHPHDHTVTFPDHRHDIENGIFTAPETPESASVRVGSSAAFVMGRTYTGDITELLIGTNGEIPRGQFVDITITPNINAYVAIAVAPQGFIQSKGGGVY